MRPASKSGKTPARAQKQPRKTPQRKASSGRPLLIIVLASLVVVLTGAVLGLLLLGPQPVLPLVQSLLAGDHAVHASARSNKHSVQARAHTKHVSAPANTAKRSVTVASDAAAPDNQNLPFEEHLPAEKETQQGVVSFSSEVHGRVERDSGMLEHSGMPGAKVTPVEASAVRPKGPLMVIVIDDMGDHPVFAKYLARLPFPVTMAILPHRPRTRSVAEFATAHGMEIILHQPMQPISYPRVNPGPGALFTDMDAERVEKRVAENLAEVPQVVGINNHMGSAFTAYGTGMAAVMRVLRAKGLFFLDSVTSPHSAAPEAAHKAGVPLYRRSVFLDNVRHVRTILGQLKTTERLAFKHGRAIAIGHPYPETLEALKIWAKQRDGRIKLVTLTQLGPES